MTKTYRYDGINRRITETVGEVTTQLVYSTQWQVLQEIVDGVTTARNVWSPVYVDAMILRDRDSDNDEFHTLDERLWVEQDANWNVTALIGYSASVWQVVERYVYDSYGVATVLYGDFGVREGGSAFAWVYLHQGGRLDTTTGNYYFRNRDFSPTLGRWTSVDPILFAAGDVNLYRGLGNNTVGRLDPSGLADEADLKAQIGDIVTKLRKNKWKPNNPDHDGAFGSAVHDSFSTRLAALKTSKFGWSNAYSSVVVENGTNKILSIGSGPGIAGTTEIDVLLMKNNKRLVVGDILNHKEIREIYDIKTTASGAIKGDQLDRLKWVKAGWTGWDKKVVPKESIKSLVTQYRYTSAKGWFPNTRYNMGVKIFGALLAVTIADGMAFACSPEALEQLDEISKVATDYDNRKAGDPQKSILGIELNNKCRVFILKCGVPETEINLAARRKVFEEYDK